jgi:uncharacterized protein involved in cysteine biosynthesis
MTAPLQVAPAAGEGAVVDKQAAFKVGLATPFRGLRFMREHRELWRHALPVILVNVVVALAILALAVFAVAMYIQRVHPLFPPTWQGTLLEALIIPLLLAGLALISVGIWFILGGIICGYLFGRLAEAVERVLGTPASELRDIPLSYQVADTARDLFWLVLINGGCVMMNIVPGIGTLAGAACSLYWDLFIFGFDFLDHPMALRGMRRAEKRAFANRHRWHTLGLGAVVMVLNFVPILGAFLQTTAVTGAVLLYHDLCAADAEPSQPETPPPADLPAADAATPASTAANTDDASSPPAEAARS